MSGDGAYPPLDWQAVAAGRAGKRIGGRIVYRPEVDSTNALAASLLPEAVAGTVVVADHQSAGRGRLGRQWIEAPCSSLAFTVVLEPAAPAWAVPMAIGLALVEALAVHGVTADLKWPNDMLVGGRKCAGILVEGRRAAGRSRLLAGIGLNVRSAEPSLPHATYLDAHAAEPVAREDLLVTILARLESWLDRAAVEPGQVRDAWRARLVTLNRAVEVQTPDGALRGRAEDVADDGALIVLLDDGTRRVVRAGDVTLAPAR